MSTQENNTSSDEIDLRELACTLWQRKGVIIGITVLTTALAAGYAYTATPVYQATASLLPPPTSALIEIYARGQQAGMPAGFLTSTETTNLFFNYLSSNAVKAQFSAAVHEKNSNAKLPSISTSKNGTNGISVTMQSSEPQHLTAYIEDYLKLGAQVTQEELNLGLRNGFKVQLEKLNYDLAVANNVAEAGKDSDKTAEQHAAAVALQTRLMQVQNNANTVLDIPIYIVDAPAATPTTPIKPKKQLIIALGLVLGGMLGSFFVLLQHAFRRP